MNTVDHKRMQNVQSENAHNFTSSLVAIVICVTQCYTNPVLHSGNAIIVPTIASVMTTMHVQGTLSRLAVTLYLTFYFLFNKPKIDTKEILRVLTAPGNREFSMNLQMCYEFREMAGNYDKTRDNPGVHNCCSSTPYSPLECTDYACWPAAKFGLSLCNARVVVFGKYDIVWGMCL